MRLHKQSLKLGKCWNESRLVKLFSETEWLRVTRTEGRDWIINRNDRSSSCSRKLHNDMKSGWNRFKHLKKHYSVKKTDAINLLSPRWYCRHKQTLLARRLVKIISDITFPRRRIHSGQINDLKPGSRGWDISTSLSVQVWFPPRWRWWWPQTACEGLWDINYRVGETWRESKTHQEETFGRAEQKLLEQNMSKYVDFGKF